jgi:hypothetical protein
MFQHSSAEPAGSATMCRCPGQCPSVARRRRQLHAAPSQPRKKGQLVASGRFDIIRRSCVSPAILPAEAHQNNARAAGVDQRALRDGRGLGFAPGMVMIVADPPFAAAANTFLWQL